MSPRDFAVLLLLAAIWGASFLFMRIATPEFGPIPLIGLRMGLGALCLAPVLVGRGKIAMLKRHWLPLASSGLLTSGLPFVLLSYATLSLNAGFTSLTNGSVPLFSAIIARFWLGERLTLLKGFGLMLGFSGLLVLIGDKLDFTPGGEGLAVLAAVCACVLYGFGANFIKRFLSDLPPQQASAGSLLGAGLVLIPLALWQAPASNPSSEAWVCGLLLALLCTGVAFVLFFSLLQRVGPTSATTVAFLIPIFGILWGAMFLNEPITGRMITGMALSFTGTAFVTGIFTRARTKS